MKSINLSDVLGTGFSSSIWSSTTSYIQHSDTRLWEISHTMFPLTFYIDAAIRSIAGIDG